MNKEQMYAEGFIAKCAEVGVDPEALIKESQYAGALGGATLGAIINALRNPKGKKRLSIKDRLVAALKGGLVGGGIGALGHYGLNKLVEGKRNERASDIAEGERRLALGRADEGAIHRTRRPEAIRLLKKIRETKNWEPVAETAPELAILRENYARGKDKVTDPSYHAAYNVRSKGLTPNPLVRVHDGLGALDAKLKGDVDKLKNSLPGSPDR